MYDTNSHFNIEKHLRDLKQRGVALPRFWRAGLYDSEDTACENNGAVTGVDEEANALSVGPAKIDWEILPATDEVFVRLLGYRGDVKVWDKVIEASQDGLALASAELPQLLNVAPQAVEQKIAEVIAKSRGQRLKKGPDNFLSQVIDSATLDGATFPRIWLVKPLIVQGQPLLVGGPNKSLKTSLMLDAALSLGTGGKFLGQFDVPAQMRVAVFSGESGEATIQETAQRICRTKGIHLSQASINWGFQLPRLGREEDLALLEKYVRDNGIQVVIIDPLYLCLLDGVSDISAANVLQMGPLLSRAGRACLNAGATPVLIHHVTKSAGLQKTRVGDPLELEDFAMAGFGEYARQWILINRRAPFEPGSGNHQMWMNIGGSAGQGGLWGVNVEEGTLDDSFRGRKWSVTVMPADRARAERIQQKDREKAEKKEAEKAAVCKKVLDFLISFPNGETIRGLAEATGCSRAVISEAIEVLAGTKQVVPTEILKSGGKGYRKYGGWKRDPIEILAAFKKEMFPEAFSSAAENDKSNPEAPASDRMTLGTDDRPRNEEGEGNSRQTKTNEDMAATGGVSPN